MLVLKILAALAALYGLYLIAIGVNRFTQKRYGYLFLNRVTLFTSLGGYFSLYFGYRWYMNMLVKHGDILNGQIVMVIGVALLLWTLYSNIKHTGLFIGIVFTVIQQILYFVVGVISIIILIMLGAAYAQAKPIYRIN
jgi:hypothetical protein